MKAGIALLLLPFLATACARSDETSALRDDTQTAQQTLGPDDCLGDQDMDAASVDVSRCPALPAYPEDAPFAGDASDEVSLGAWELGTTSDGLTYKYGELELTPTGGILHHGGSSPVDALNVECWAKGYYRLRKMLQNPPKEYVALREAGYQTRFFQFQTDLRNGGTGFRRISSYMDHLVKWVTVITPQGVCVEPTLAAFTAYAKAELQRRGIPNP